MNAAFFEANRQKLVESLKGGLVVLAANNAMQQTSDGAAPFRQEGNFWYLTGIDEPDWQVIIDGVRGKSWLVAPERDEIHTIFEGAIDGDAAAKTSGITTVIERTEAESLLRSLAKQHGAVHTVFPDEHVAHAGFVVNPAQRTLKKQLDRQFASVIDCRLQLAKLRAIKSPEEIASIEAAVELTMSEFARIKPLMHSFQHEYEIEAEFTYGFRRNNAVHAYEPIVAAGKNACTLHYVANNATLKNTETVLLDIGARKNGYDADITRTYARRTVSKRTKTVHAELEAAHKEIISCLEPGLTVQHYQELVDARMKRALANLGLLKSLNDETTYRTYFPHAISHGLGIDTHDSLGRTHELRPGMVLTVEPGIYIPEERLGMRIEDDILITDSGYKNLSAGLPTTL